MGKGEVGGGVYPIRFDDYEFKYLVGKVGTDDDDLPLKLDKDTFIITQVVPIPSVKSR